MCVAISQKESYCRIKFISLLLSAPQTPQSVIRQLDCRSNGTLEKTDQSYKTVSHWRKTNQRSKTVSHWRKSYQSYKIPSNMGKGMASTCRYSSVSLPCPLDVVVVGGVISFLNTCISMWCPFSMYFSSSIRPSPKLLKASAVDTSNPSRTSSASARPGTEKRERGEGGEGDRAERERGGITFRG